ncbi:MAG: hypothetical protein OXC63_13515 [Aestuariivita sp.]|nr:hypothetical protein [Aestuariivita sp.]MCY4347904.1 hypothetical protein [Aestuariivita sp.]
MSFDLSRIAGDLLKQCLVNSQQSWAIAWDCIVIVAACCTRRERGTKRSRTAAISGASGSASGVSGKALPTAPVSGHRRDQSSPTGPLPSQSPVLGAG